MPWLLARACFGSPMRSRSPVVVTPQRSSRRSSLWKTCAVTKASPSALCSPRQGTPRARASAGRRGSCRRGSPGPPSSGVRLESQSYSGQVSRTGLAIGGRPACAYAARRNPRSISMKCPIRMSVGAERRELLEDGADPGPPAHVFGGDPVQHDARRGQRARRLHLLVEAVGQDDPPLGDPQAAERDDGVPARVEARELAVDDGVTRRGGSQRGEASAGLCGRPRNGHTTGSRPCSARGPGPERAR